MKLQYGWRRLQSQNDYMKPTIKMTKNAKAVALGNNEMSYEERLENAIHADEIEALFSEKEPKLVTVLKKFQVTPMLYHLAANQLDSIKNNLVDGFEYEASELVSDEYWTEYDWAWRRELELCIKHFAANPRSRLTDTKTGKFVLAD